MAPSDPQPFEISTPEADLADLRERLTRTRWPDDPDNETGRFGARRSYLEPFIRYWLEDYDWRAVETELNAFPNFRVTLDGQVVHYVHVRGEGPAPFPVVLTHGYPWTYWDYRKVIGPLTNPSAYGGDPADAFDVVVPSLPGYAFSNPMRAGGISARQTAGLWVSLMRGVLGYGKFGAAGGDWGAMISILLGHLFPDDLAGIYVTLADFSPALRNRFDPFDLADLSPEEREWYDREWRKKPKGAPFGGPTTLFRQPQTDAYAGHDSPLALAVNIIESRLHAGDTGGDVESQFTREELVTNTMLYWVTNTWASARRFYWHTVRDPVPPAPEGSRLIDVPTGVGVYPADVFYVARKHVERDANLVQWDYHDAGGHFAADEEPEAFVDDLRRFYRPLR